MLSKIYHFFNKVVIAYMIGFVLVFTWVIFTKPLYRLDFFPGQIASIKIPVYPLTKTEYSSTVLIYEQISKIGHDHQAEFAHGTGVIVGHPGPHSYIILTAHHMVIKALRYTIIFHNGIHNHRITADYLGKIIKIISDPSGRDMALMLVSGPSGEPVVPFSDGLPKDSTPLVVLGHPIDSYWVPSYGVYLQNGFLSIRSDSSYILCGGCASGDSGAGVFTQKGELVGEFFATYNFSQNDRKDAIEQFSGVHNASIRRIGYFVDVQLIRSFLHNVTPSLVSTN